MNQDRRQFYRIDKWVALEFQLLDAGSEETDLPQPGTFQVTPHFMLPTELENLNQALSEKLGGIAKASPEIADFLNLLNQKIDKIAQSLGDREQLGVTLRSDKVNLSEGGLSFNLEQPLSLEQIILVRLVVPELKTGLRLVAQVKRCIAKQGVYDIGLEFLSMPEACRTTLARLIYRSQIEQHKATKEHETDGKTS